MPNYSRKVCRLERRCQPVNLTQGLSCTFHHADEKYADVCAKAQIKEWRAKRLCSESQAYGHRIQADELARLIKATGRFDLIDLWLRDHDLDQALSVVEKPLAGDTSHVVKHFLAAVAAHGAVGIEFERAMSDGLLQDHEIPPVRDVLRKSQDKNAELDASLRARETQSRQRRVVPHRRVG